MINKRIITLILMCTAVQAEIMIPITGKVVRIENKKAVILSNGKEISIPMKNVSKETSEKIFKENGSKKIVTIYVPPQAFISK